MNDNKLFKKFFMYFFTIIIFISITFYVLINSIHENVLSSKLNPVTQNIVNTIFLEGFGFFTKDPKGEHLDFFRLRAGIVKKINLKNVSNNNNFGLSRKTRRILLELGKIQRKIPDSLWCKTRNDSVNFNKIIKNTEILTLAHNEDLKIIEPGKYFLIKYKPIVWEWNQLKKNYEVSYTYFEIVNK